MKADVCVIGAGPAGLAVAAGLCQFGRDVIVLERKWRRKAWGGESFTGSIRAPLVALGFWPTFQRSSHLVGYERESAWGGEPRSESSVFWPTGPMWHVDRDRFDRDLRFDVSSFARFEELRGPWAVEHDQTRGWRLRMSDGSEIATRFLVDATGRSRVLARKFHARVEFHDRLIGLASSVTATVERSVRSMTVRAAPFGWWYAAPTPRGHVVTLFTDSDLAPRKAEHRLQPVAANSAFTHWDAAEDWLPVGDAYASHDPLCGWGVVRALNNGRLAADSIEEYLHQADRSQINAYRSHCEAQFKRYLDGLKSRYTMEDRWPSAPFWARRRSV